MQLENFESAWKQLKLSNAMRLIDSQEILLMIDSASTNDRTKLQTILFNVALFVVVTIFCQGG